MITPIEEFLQDTLAKICKDKFWILKGKVIISNADYIRLNKELRFPTLYQDRNGEERIYGLSVKTYRDKEEAFWWLL